MADDDLSTVSVFTVTTAELMPGAWFIELDLGMTPAFLSPEMALELADSLRRNVDLLHEASDH